MSDLYLRIVTIEEEINGVKCAESFSATVKMGECVKLCCIALHCIVLCYVALSFAICSDLHATESVSKILPLFY